MRVRATIFTLLALGQGLHSRVALACSWAPPEKLLIEADPGDVTPPSAATIESETHRNPDERDGCATQSNSCHGTASLGLQVQATDDVTASAELGYLVEVVESNVALSGGSEPIV